MGLARNHVSIGTGQIIPASMPFAKQFWHAGCFNGLFLEYFQAFVMLVQIFYGHAVSFFIEVGTINESEPD